MTLVNQKYDCNICEDSGYVPVKEEPTRLETCECEIERSLRKRAELNRYYSNITQLDTERFRLDNFDPKKQLTKKGIADATMLLKLLNSWRKREIKILTIIGGVGIGKTHLSIATMMQVLKQDQGYYAPASEVSVKSRNFEYNEAENYRSKLQSVEWLVLDDVGVEHDPRGYMQTFYHSVIDYRYSQQLQTLITTNLSINGKKKDSLLKRLGERIVSRLNHKGISLCYEAEGQDIRRIK